MLKIQDASGEVIGVLKDDDASPKMTNKPKEEEVKEIVSDAPSDVQ